MHFTFLFTFLFRGDCGRAMMLDKFQCQCILLIRIIEGQGPSILAGGAGGNCLTICFLAFNFSSLFLWETINRQPCQETENKGGSTTSQNHATNDDSTGQSKIKKEVDRRISVKTISKSRQGWTLPD